MKYWSHSKIQIPKLGFGTYCLKGEIAISAVQHALKRGFRHIDTATIYENEEEIGLAIQKSPISRKEIFITTKLWLDCLEEKGVVKSLQSSLKKLKTNYIDLLLIHWYNPKVDLKETLTTLSQLQKEKKVHHIGVSNFTCDLLKEAKKIAPQIITNQVEYHPLLSQRKLLTLIESEFSDIFLTAYSPLIRGKINQIQQVVKIAEKYNKTPSQVALKWLIDQKNVVVIFKSSNKDHIDKNKDIFDFELEKEDQEKLFRLNKNNQRVINPPFAPEWDN
ncbi:MAG: aldo/keto reductase [Bdellovibrionales bacterium]|nr:aldo/keto reductase [Bdellovibrionales bacterium]